MTSDERLFALATANRLLAAGRPAALADVAGPGVEVLAGRIR